MTDMLGGVNKAVTAANQANAAITTVEQALVAFGPQIAVADMLIHLGIATAKSIHSYFASKVSDDQILAGIMAEVDQRIARRS
jgi:hypothetical protein